jgi:heptosyltransferase-2
MIGRFRSALAKSGDVDELGPTPRIVVVVRDHMSGVPYSVPHARAIRQRFPDARITLLTSAYSAPVLDGGAMYYDNVLPLYTFSDEPRRFDRIRDLGSKAKTWGTLVGRVDLVIHLRTVGGSTLAFCALLGRPIQVGEPQNSWLDRLLTVTTAQGSLALGSRQRNTLILEEYGIPVESEEMEICVADDDRRWAERWLADAGHVDGEPIIVVHPGCHWGCNQWLIDRWQRTADALLDEHGGTVVVTGSNRERSMAQEIVGGVAGRCVNSAGETTLGTFAALISMAKLVVAVDTAPTQICQALKIPSVIMMGDGTMSWNGPIGDEPMVMLQELDPNRPEEVCRWSDGACNGPLCTSRLEAITVDSVLESTVEVLSRPS